MYNVLRDKMINQELELLKDFESNSGWFYKNISIIRKDGFTGKFVAVKNKKVISSGDSVDLVISSLEDQGENPAYIFIEFVHPEGFTLIL